MATDNIPGKWQMTESENFDAFMERVGVGYIVRKLGNASKPLVTITKDNGDKFTLKQESLVKTSEIKFQLGKQFDELTADGRNVKSTMTLESPNVLVHEMLGTNGGKDSTCWRDFGKEEMLCTCKVDDIVTVRKYKRV